ncbi:MAG TPA: MarR family transcriptional regulator [Patescibacteria group bacterium]|nr:MarR family transcriptional regulator [Patescibacteria group bacterium]
MNLLEQMSLEQAQQLPGVLLWHTSKLWQQWLNKALKPYNLSSTNAVILVNLLHLSFEQKQITQVAVARLSGTDMMTTSTILRTLERKGFIQRTASTHDKRANQLALTPLGQDVAYRALQTIAHTHQTFFKAIEGGRAEAFVDSLKELLRCNGESNNKAKGDQKK